MNRVREVLRYKEHGLSQREIHKAVGIARSTVQGYLGLAEVRGITYEQAQKLSDSDLRLVFGRKSPGRQSQCEDPDFERIHKELNSRKGMTLELLWQEWLEMVAVGCSYSVFCRRYRKWAGVKKVVMRNAYRGGEFGLCDYSGELLSWFDENGQERKAEIFVGVLGASNYTYAEAVESQKLLNWLGSTVRFLDFIQGVPQALVIDNLKSGVTKSCRYEPEINRSYQELGAHYDTAICATRARAPRDKAKVEKAVQEVQRWLLAPLRDRKFYSIAEMNEAMRPLLDKLNDRPMQDYNASRREMFSRVDQPALKKLPDEHFRLPIWKSVMIGLDYHVQIDKHYYSVPYWLARKQVWVRMTERLVEIFHDNLKIASHLRSHTEMSYSTSEAHMPENHRAVRSWTPEFFKQWSKTIGEHTQSLVEQMLEEAKHESLACRSILGLQRLARKFSCASLEFAAAVALERRVHTQRFVRLVLEEKAFGVKCQENTSLNHANIRGPEYFH